MLFFCLNYESERNCMENHYDEPFKNEMKGKYTKK